MKHKLIMLLTALLFVPMGIFSQTYQQMWKQAEEAMDKDLPQSAIQHLQKIERKALKEEAYGQLLKSTLLHARLQAEVAPDSLLPAVKRLEQQAQQTTSIPLRAVYHAVLSQVYRNNHQLGEDYLTRSEDYKTQALAHPEALAQVKTDAYEPFIVRSKDSELFGHDLLSVVGQELEAWAMLNTYYDKAGNRPAACLTASKTVKTIRQADSLLAVYGDLNEAGEVAIQRYELMGNVTAKEKYDWLVQAINRWGAWKRANNLRNALTRLTNAQFEVEVPHQVAIPQEQQTVQLKNLRSLQSMTMRVWRTQLLGNADLSPDNKDDLQTIMKGAQELTMLKRTVNFAPKKEYEVFGDSLTLEGLPAGIYLVEFTSVPATYTVRSLYYVSGVRLLIETQPGDKKRYELVDARTGHPLKNGQLKDDEGRYKNRLFAYTPDDKYLPLMNSWGRYYYQEQAYGREHTSLFTDRSLYRPGQTVCVAGITWKEESVTDNISVGNKKMTLELRDANYKLVSEQQVTTDQYGKCGAQFTLPQGLLNGQFTIRTEGASVSFNVEEYKRPTFEVEFDEYKESYKAGDTIQGRGRTLSYAGVPVQGAKVHYTVKRRVAFWWMTYSHYWSGGYFGRGLNEEQLYEGDALTDDEGYFSVQVPLLMPQDLMNAHMYYHFVVEADVTDQAGESHQGTMSLPLGTKPTALTCDLPQEVRSDEMPEVVFSRRNAAGKEIEGTVKYRIDHGKWKECKANSPLSIANGKPLPSGEHRLEGVCEEDTIDLKFIVFGLDDKVPATQTHDWFYCSDSRFPNDGTPVTLQVGSSDPDLYIFYSIFSGKKLIEGGHVERNAALVNRKLTYKEEYGNGLLITYAWVKDGECYRHQQTIRRPMPDKQLRLSWETFRDHLTPGQQEEWRLTIKNPDGTPADASLMAVLYDKSLDQLKQHKWSFGPSNYLPLPSTSWQWMSWGKLQGNASKDYKTLHVPNIEYSHFDQSVYPTYHEYVRAFGRMRYKTASMPTMMASKSARNASAQLDEEGMVALGTAEADDKVVAEYVEAEEAKTGETEATSTIRENLNETAFCYPDLVTDEQGGVTLKFTLPESLTTWRFMGVANTKDMLYGYLGGEAVAKKDVMIQPNIPRFIRMGDEAHITARIINTSEQVKSGQVMLQLLDPKTNKVVMEQIQTVNVEAGKTGATTFSVPCASFTESLLVCKMTVKGEGFSDGEQHYLPILPDREYVTKTVPYTQHEAGVKTIDLTKLFPAGTTQQKLTVEYTNNPTWLMVQALPVIGQPCKYSAIDHAASYYSNLLAKTLMDQNPQVKDVFEQWKHEDASQSSLHSALEKNQELKDLVLEETPWVNSANRETEQKQRLADFFDKNMISHRLDMAVSKLKDLQNADGSFSWYPGMPGSTHITVAVEEMLVRLNLMTGAQNDTKKILTKTFDYMGKEMTDLVAKLREQEKKGHKPSFPSFTALRWLYLCALDGRQLSKEVKSANEYLIVLLKKDIKRQSIYEKALTAIVLSKHGDHKKAAEYVQSLKEFTVYTEEMGRYYDTRRASYSWYDYKIPTEVAAIEAIQAITPQDVKTVDEMRRWLLQEKRTQAWNTPINSVNAIWAFLNGNSQKLIANSQKQTVLAIDQQPIELPKATAGMGYVKTDISEPKGQTFTATKTSEGTSWGAVYAQFMQKTSDIEASQSGISVKREVLTAKGEQLTANSLQTGARIKVRITIESTRDLDFVQVVDRRAACMEPIHQLSGYQRGVYISPKDYATNYYYYGLSKGKHVIETEYYIDRAGKYETGTCSVQCAYAPEYRATAPSITLYAK